jgi:hypothetical protein
LDVVHIDGGHDLRSELSGPPQVAPTAMDAPAATHLNYRLLLLGAHVTNSAKNENDIAKMQR